MTRQAVYLIETGKVRPSSRTLEAIAVRLGRPAAYFLAGAAKADGTRSSAAVEELQAFCLQQKFDAAVSAGLGMLEGDVDPTAEAWIRLYVGQALVRSSRPDQGLEHLHRAQALLAGHPDPWLAVECADWEAAALYLKEDRRALSVAEHALKLCRATRPAMPGTEARILEHIATIHVKNHTYDQAIAFYEQALAAAEAVRDLSRLGRTYHGLSIAYQERGDLARAVEFTHRALALYALEHDKALLGRGENELGLLLMRQGQMARAEETLLTALRHFEEAGAERAKSHVLLSLAELQLKTSRFEEAVATVRSALDLATRLDERLAIGAAHVLLGRLYESTERRRLADREFAAAIDLYAGEDLRERLAESHAAYAQVLEARGQERAAGRHWKEAASVALRPQAGARAV